MEQKIINKVLHGNVIEILRTIPDEIADVCFLSPVSEIKNVLNELYRIAKAGASLYFRCRINWNKTHPVEYLKSQWILWQDIIIDRGVKIRDMNRFWHSDDHLFWLIKPGKEIKPRYQFLSSIWRIYKDADLVIPIRCILSVSAKGNTVVDPNCTDGSTIVAAKLLRHNYIAISQNPKKIEERINNYKREYVILKKALEDIKRYRESEFRKLQKPEPGI